MGLFNYQNTTVHYEERGTGKPFVFLHGLGGEIAQPMDAFAPADDVRLITLDFPGHGETKINDPVKELNFSYFAKLVNALLDHLGIKEAYIGGISMGAATSMRFALDFPQRTKALAIVRPAWLAREMDEDIQNVFGKIARYLQTNDPNGFKADATFKKIEQEYPAIYASFSNFFVLNKNPLPFLHIPGQKPFATMEELKKIEQKTVVVATKQDFLHPFEYGEKIAAAIPGAKFVELVSKSVDSKLHKDQLQAVLLELLNA